MTLQELSKELIQTTKQMEWGNDPLDSLLFCPQYSPFAQEVKTYPSLKKEGLFALCWHMDAKGCLHAALCLPSKIRSCHYSFAPQEKTQLHTHDYLELSYVMEGTFTQKILDKEITFQKGDLCLIDKNCLHQDYLVNGSATILFLGIANDMFAEIMDENVTAQNIILFLKPALLKQKDLQQYLHFRPENQAAAHMEDCLCQLLFELKQATIGSLYICRGLLMRIFHILSTEYEISFSKEQKKNINWLVFQEVSHYIRQHYDTITIRKLCQVFHFQEDYFNRLIRNKTGLTYSGYVQQIRLEEAARLLVSSSKNIEEIAAAVGYRNKGYFYKIFQEKYQMTPAKYRQQAKTIS